MKQTAEFFSQLLSESGVTSGQKKDPEIVCAGVSWAEKILLPIGSLNWLALLAWFLECKGFLRRIFTASKNKTAFKKIKIALNRKAWTTYSQISQNLISDPLLYFQSQVRCRTRAVLQPALPNPSPGFEQIGMRPIPSRLLLGLLLITKWFLPPLNGQRTFQHLLPWWQQLHLSSALKATL